MKKQESKRIWGYNDFLATPPFLCFRKEWNMGRMVIDQFNEVKMPDVYLAQKNKHILGCLNAVSNLKNVFFLK